MRSIAIPRKTRCYFSRHSKKPPTIYEYSTSARTLIFYAAKYFLSDFFLKKISRETFFSTSRKYFLLFLPWPSPRFSEEKTVFWFLFKKNNSEDSRVFHVHTKKSLIFIFLHQYLLTRFRAIPISCGQGSGHPHPVVVDNVLGGFGDWVSPEAFGRL